jgi:hypothetical protein
MTTDPFEELIHKLGEELNVPLGVDRHRACAINIHETLTVQIQLDASQEKLLIASFVADLPPGKFRENVLGEALKTNHLEDPRTAILGYLAMTNKLVLYQRYPFVLLDAKKLAEYVAGFIDYAEIWREAISRGQTSPAPIQPSIKPPPFGMRR